MTNVAAVSELLKPFDARLMRRCSVSTRMNSVPNDDAECSVISASLFARNFVVSLAGKVYDALGEFRGLPPANCLFRLSSNCTRILVPVLELFRTSVPTFLDPSGGYHCRRCG